MNTLRFDGFRGILCLTGLLLVSMLPLQAKAGEPERASAGSIEVRMREAGCSTEAYLSDVVTEVCSVLVAIEPEGSGESARLALEAAYGDAVTPVAAPYEYVWIKVDGVWMLHCFMGAAFEIDFGAHGTVVVKVRAMMPVAQP